jgi:hypothetical protein
LWPRVRALQLRRRESGSAATSRQPKQHWQHGPGTGIDFPQYGTHFTVYQYWYRYGFGTHFNKFISVDSEEKECANKYGGTTTHAILCRYGTGIISEVVVYIHNLGTGTGTG